MSFSFQGHYILDKNYYLECYDQTAQLKQGKKAYSKALILFLIGCFITFISDEYQVIALFMMALSAIEAFGVLFHRTWWLWRQLLSKASGTRIDFTIDEQKINITSRFNILDIPWEDVVQLVKTSKGFIIERSSDRYYLSASYLSEEVIEKLLLPKVTKSKQLS